MKKLIILFAAIACFATTALAQDLMYLRNKKVIEVQVVEIGLSEIKYKNFPPRLDEPVITIEKTKIEKIEMENGEVLTFAADAFSDADMYANQKKNAVKINFLSPLGGSFITSYERSIKPGQSFEVDLGIVGAGVDLAETNPSGLFVRGGYKFIRTPDFYVAGMRYAHILKGAYIKPELIFTSYNEDNNSYDPWTGLSLPSSRDRKTGGAFMLNFGKQVVYSDAFLFDWFLGIGYGFSNNQGIRYGFLGGNNEIPIAFSWGVKIGLLVK